MKFKILLLTIVFWVQLAYSQTDILFKTGMEYILNLNDTGILFAGEYPSGNNPDCTSSTTILSEQDCNSGRDVSHTNNSNGIAGFDFTKLDDTGVPLVDQSIDYSTTQWRCVKDNVTGLIWEVKNELINNVHYKDNRYRWGGITAIGRDNPNRVGDYYDDWNELVNTSNTNNYCGSNEWRVPSIEELVTIVNYGRTNPAIDINYFPNTSNGISIAYEYWSSSPSAVISYMAWAVLFRSGKYSDHPERFNYKLVRLVR